MKYIFIMLLWCITIMAKAQPPNNPIFGGGVADGFDRNSFAQAGNNIFTGGTGDGFDRTSFAQAVNNIFTGGEADGWNFVSFAQPANGIFNGGNGDGWNFNNFAQAGNSIFNGGVGDGWASTYRPQGPLPVTWGDFTASKYNERSSLLTWVTLQEFNTTKFIIERSPDAVTFKVIGEKPATGNSQTVHTYTYVDDTPLAAENFYRIRQIDQDGRFTYSPARMLKFDAIGKTGFVKIYPNPTKGPLNIEIPSTLQNKEFVINIISANGVVVNQLKVSVTQSGIFSTDMSSYASGTYIVQLRSEQENITTKVVLQ